VVVSNQAFVAMPFHVDFDPVWLKIVAACQHFGVVAYRVDKDPSPGDIISHIIAGIQTSRFVIADLSRGNTNVAFEVGFSYALRKDIVLMIDDIMTLPFDVRNLRAIAYERSTAGLDRLEERLGAVIRYVLERPLMA
jgi:hypothetical protein